VRQAEENLHSASALIGVARANRLPSFALTADIGSMAVIFSRMFTLGPEFWDLGAGVTQPVFEGGTLVHRQRTARAAYVQAAQQYRSTVLTAFENVADHKTGGPPSSTGLSLRTMRSTSTPES
jgi:outer membrane protein TolC